MITTIDVSCDLGESYGNFVRAADAELIPLITSANVACGFHAGDPVHMDKAVGRAKQHGVSVGVHFGLLDIHGFGRRRIDVSAEEVYAMTVYQVGALRGFADAHGTAVTHLLPHGILYSMLAEETLGRAAVLAVKATLPLGAFYWPTPLQPHAFYDIAKKEGFRVVPALAVDLDYRADGSLVVERVKLARDETNIADRLRRFIKTGKLSTIDGTELAFEAQVLNFHSDGPNALEVAQSIRKTLAELDITVASVSAKKSAGSSHFRQTVKREKWIRP